MINKFKATHLDLASEYLVMASTLVQLKAKTLLQNPLEATALKEEKKYLLKQLSEYQQFKLIASKLKAKAQIRQQIFIKKTSNYEP